MKKFITLFIIILQLFILAYANEICFTPDGGGKYIYCNNNEFITREQLADSSGFNPTYLMTNQDMREGKYTLYFSHINRTELKNLAEYDTSDVPKDLSDEKKKYFSDIMYPGFAIEVDVSFTANADTTIKITSLGFEVQKVRNYYYTNRLINYEDSWGCLNAVSDYFKMPIYTQNSELKYEPNIFPEKEIFIKKGETVWLSKYIENYEAVGWLKPVHLLCDFEIINGGCDIKIGAFRSKTELRDRSGLSEKAAHGRFWRDGQYKGIADTLPSVSTNLSFEIDDSFNSGDLLPVKIFNQYLPNGLEVSEWLTHINPQHDANARRIAAENDIITLYYKDSEKLKLYDKNYTGEKNDVWIFNPYYSNTRLGGNPNFKLDPSKYNVKKSAGLANYCVKTNYNIKIKNNGEKARFFNYNAKCTSNIITYITNADGTLQNPYLTAKGYKNDAELETLCTKELPPGETTEFTLTVFLPINYVGGIRNSFAITDEKKEIQYFEDMKQGNVKDIKFTGKNYITYKNGVFYISENNKDFKTIQADEKVKEIFQMEENAYKIVSVGNKYFVMYKDFAETPAFYSGMTSHVSYVYVLDENFKLTDTIKFRDGFPFMVSYAGKNYYIRSDRTWTSQDLKKWKTGDFFDEGEFSLPFDNGSGIILLAKVGGETYLSPDNGKNYYMIRYPDGDKKPRYIDVLGDLYFYAENNMLYTSSDGIEWTSFDAEEKIVKLSRQENNFIVNDSIEIPASAPALKKRLIFNSELIKFSGKTFENTTDLLVPAKEILSKSNLEYTLSKDNKTLTIKADNNTFEFHGGSNIAIKKGKRKDEKNYLKNSCVIKNGELLIPVYDVFSCLGLECEYFENSKCYVIKTFEAF